jgi:hypothetical protein
MTPTHAGYDCYAELPTACGFDNRAGPQFCQKQSGTFCLLFVQASLRRGGDFAQDDCEVGIFAGSIWVRQAANMGAKNRLG